MSSQPRVSGSSQPVPSGSTHRVKRERSPLNGVQVKEEEEEREDTPPSQELDEVSLRAASEMCEAQR